MVFLRLIILKVRVSVFVLAVPEVKDLGGRSKIFLKTYQRRNYFDQGLYSRNVMIV